MAYSTLLGLLLPSTGSLTGTWGSSVNSYLTAYLDAAVAGTQNVTVDTDITLSIANGTALDANSSQYAIIRCSGARTALRTITTPASSKTYIVINATTGGYGVKVVGSGPTTGITVNNGKAAVIVWNGSDWTVVSSNDAVSLTSGITGTLGAANGGTGVANNAANTLTFSGNYGLTLTLTNTTSVTLPTSGTLVSAAGAQTLTNKRIDPRVSSTASAATVTPDVSAYDIYAFNALAANLTINAPTGTPVDGDKLFFRILDNGTSRTLTWDSTYTQIGVPLPTATTINKTSYVGCIYNANASRWDVVSVTTQF